MRIAEVFRLTGASTRSIRLYERAGLMAAKRGKNGYRNFVPGDIERVRNIRAFLANGLSLNDVRELAPHLDEPRGADCLCPETIAIYQDKLAEMEARITPLEEVRGAFRKRIEAAESLPS